MGLTRSSSIICLRLWVLNNEKMISMFILNSFYLEYKKEMKPDLKNIFKFFLHVGKVVKNPKWSPYMGLIKQFNISCPEVNNAASSTWKSYMVS